MRASRRLAERPEIGADALATDLRLRDDSDPARMRPAEDAQQIDTSDLDVEHVVDQIEALVRARQPPRIGATVRVVWLGLAAGTVPGGGQGGGSPGGGVHERSQWRELRVGCARAALRVRAREFFTEGFASLFVERARVPASASGGRVGPRGRLVACRPRSTAR